MSLFLLRCDIQTSSSLIKFTLNYLKLDYSKIIHSNSGLFWDLSLINALFLIEVIFEIIHCKFTFLANNRIIICSFFFCICKRKIPATGCRPYPTPIITEYDPFNPFNALKIARALQSVPVLWCFCQMWGLSLKIIAIRNVDNAVGPEGWRQQGHWWNKRWRKLKIFYGVFDDKKIYWKVI